MDVLWSLIGGCYSICLTMYILCYKLKLDEKKDSFFIFKFILLSIFISIIFSIFKTIIFIGFLYLSFNQYLSELLTLSIIITMGIICLIMFINKNNFKNNIENLNIKDSKELKFKNIPTYEVYINVSKYVDISLNNLKDCLEFKELNKEIDVLKDRILFNLEFINNKSNKKELFNDIKLYRKISIQLMKKDLKNINQFSNIINKLKKTNRKG